MSGFAVIFSRKSQSWRDGEVPRALRRALRLRGEELCESYAGEEFYICAVRNRWEEELHPGPLIAREGPITVVADATLYYRDDLRARLGEVNGRPPASPAELIIGVYARYGERCAEMLEGDFAYAIVDARSGSVRLGRDPFGSRGLWYARLPEGCVAASTPDAVREVSGDQGLDTHEIIRRLSFWTGRGSSSVWRGVAELPAGHSVTLGERASTPVRFWRPAINSDLARLSLDAAAEALREVLGRAVAERLAPGTTAVAMSGGRDSTAVVGALASVSGPSSLRERLRVISLGYPSDDPGNEDEHVHAVAQALGVEIHWVPTEGIPLVIDSPPDRERRVDPEPHPYEGQNQALAAASQAVGASVLLNGHGGDSVFSATPMWPADLLRQGRWLRYARELRSRRLPLWRSTRDYYIRAAMPESLLQAAEEVRGRPLWDRPWVLPRIPWLRLDDKAWAELEAEHRTLFFEDPWSGWWSTSRTQRRWALIFSGFTRTNAALNGIYLSNGVELRMPIFDRRVVDFAWSREAADLCGVKETKLLLTRSMEGVLPDSVIAPRPHRTGTADGYSLRHFRRFLQESSSAGLQGGMLAGHGLLDEASFKAAVSKVSNGGSDDALPLLVSIGIDRWLTLA